MSSMLKVSFESKPSKADMVVVFTGEGGKLGEAARSLDAKTNGALKRAIAAEKFEGKKGQLLTVAGPAGVAANHIVLAGLGKAEDLSFRDFEKIGSSLTAAANARKASAVQVVFSKGDVKKLVTEEAAAHLASAATLSSYRFDKYFTKEPKEKKPTLKTMKIVVSAPAWAKEAFSDDLARAEAIFFTRDLVSEPPNVLYPESYANLIKKEFKGTKVAVNVLGVKEMQKLGMGGILAVGMGSDQKPRLVTMQYNGGKKGDKPVAFVGKGVTFDTGGISIKPGPGMEDMKWDMAGSATVVGLMKSLAARRAKVNAVGVVALAENMPSGNAYRPGDIVTSMSGQTIEVQNTDAEGRVILCDALWYAQEKFKPTHVIDLATLTGAILVALGGEYAGAFSNDDKLMRDLLAAGKETGEELWHMPLNDAWNKAIDSTQADMKNISGGRDAGSSVGAHFLQRFIQKGVKWSHLDIAGVAWSNKDRTNVPKGASAFGVRLLDRYVTDVWEK
jgi:leucyl aminopeptidase